MKGYLIILQEEFHVVCWCYVAVCWMDTVVREGFVKKGYKSHIRSECNKIPKILELHSLRHLFVPLQTVTCCFSSS